MTKEHEKRLKAYSHMITARYRDKKERPISSKVVKMEETISHCDSMCEGGKGDVARIVSAFMGKRISWTRARNQKTIKFRTGMIIVQTGNEGGHNYRLNEPIICFSNSRYGMHSDGFLGNMLDGTSRTIRYATTEEIDKFFKDFTAFEELMDRMSVILV